MEDQPPTEIQISVETRYLPEQS
ncbi:MAG: Co2+/Mg2+ efflux protein ApaG, partial [Acidithiobacillus sp.]|nr:Co2+/Mg2+ efflux protein ApaG [Acidithiobacillus sp.]